jgi:UDP-glucose 4-epimerase
VSSQIEALRWVVTGAAGFLGSQLVDELLLRGQMVLALDNLEWGRVENIQRHSRQSSFRFAQIDIRDFGNLTAVLSDFGPDCVAHLAALHYIPAAMADPVSTVAINVLGTQAVLTAALVAGATRIWFASTGDVYGPSEEAHLETEIPRPFNIYGLTKLQSEQLIEIAAQSHPECNFVIGRLFNLYGPGETNPHLIPEIMRQLAEKADAPLKLGNLWPRRDLTPVRDAARAIVDMLLRSRPGVTIANVGTGHAHSIDEVLGILRRLTGAELRVEIDPRKVRSVERSCLQANIDRLSKMIGWGPHSDLTRGLSELVASISLSDDAVLGDKR